MKARRALASVPRRHGAVLDSPGHTIIDVEWHEAAVFDGAEAA